MYNYLLNNFNLKMINTKYDLFEINEVKWNENKMLEEIKFIENDIKNIISKNESYYKDSALRFFANLWWVSQNFVNLAKKKIFQIMIILNLLNCIIYAKIHINFLSYEKT